MLRGRAGGRRSSSPEVARPDAPGAGDLVPAAEHRGAERGDAPAAADRGGAGPRAAARHLRAGDLLGRGRRRPGGRGPRRCSRRSGSGRSSRPIPPRRSASPCWRSTGASTAGWWSWSRPAGRRASAQALVAGLRNEIELLLAHRRAAARQADRAPGGVLGPPLLQRDAVRGGARPAWTRSSGRWRSTIPARRSSVPAFFQFGSWIGGDRDGNPVRHQRRHPQHAAARTGSPALRRYHRRLGELVRALSITERSVPPSDRFREALERELAATGEAEAIASRNPGEIFRQYLADDAPAARGDDPGHRARRHPARSRGATPRPTRSSPTSGSSSPSWWRPGAASWPRRWCGRCAARSRRSASAPSGWTSGRTPPSSTPRSRALRAATDRRRRAAGRARDAWRAWLAAELARPLTPDAADAARCPTTPPRRWGCSRWCAELREEIDREAFGTFVLSMTRSVSDVLGAYLLAKDGRAVRRHAGRRELHPPDRAAVRDDRRPAARARHHEGAAHRAAGAPERAGAGRGAGGHDRLLRLQQGRRVPRVQLGALQGADQADPGGPRVRGARSPSSTAAAAR